MGQKMIKHMAEIVALLERVGQIAPALTQLVTAVAILLLVYRLR
jgi:hypothetical protein